MGTILASALINRVRTILEDPGGVRWGDLELLDWLNDAQREIVELRPSANVKTVTRQLAAGTKQAMPTDTVMLLDIVRNMGTNGSTPGVPIRQTTRQLMDTQLPGWHADAAATEVEHFIYDPQAPKVFWVYPQSPGTNHVELQYSAVPADVPNTASVISLDDQYANALLDGMLYRVYAKDTEHEGSEQRATAYRISFETRLGTKAQSDAATAAANAPEKR